jgi:hypothetical protein
MYSARLYAHIFLLAVKMKSVDDVLQVSISKLAIRIVHQDFALLS